MKIIILIVNYILPFLIWHVSNTKRWPMCDQDVCILGHSGASLLRFWAVPLLVKRPSSPEGRSVWAAVEFEAQDLGRRVVEVDAVS